MTRGDETRAQDIVSEAFTRVFRAMSRNGNVSSFWPYLLTSVRNVHRAELRRTGRVDLVERAADLDGLLPVSPSGEGENDPGVHAAFRRLPARWQTVLWRSEICGDTAAEIGSDLGITANAAAALACRAREGLRVEYLRGHLTSARTECRPYAEQLAKLVRGMLGRRDRRKVEAHVRICDECGRALADLTALNGRMRSVLPLILGVAPFATGHGMTSGSAGAVSTGLVGSAGAASGAIGTAGLTGAAGVAGVGGVTAIGITHATAIAGLAVASVVAVLGLPAETPAAETVPPPPAQTSVVPDGAAVADDPVDPLVQAHIEVGESAADAGQPADASMATGGGTLAGLSTDPTAAGELGTMTSEQPVTGSDLVGGVTPELDGGTGEPTTTPKGPGGSKWSWSDEDATGPGHSDAAHGKNGSGGPESGPGAGHGESAKPEHAAEPTRDGPAQPARPTHAAEPSRDGPATPSRPTQAAEAPRPTHDPSDNPGQGDKSQVGKATNPAPTSRHRQARTVVSRFRPRSRLRD
jgi:RNA polymerase sigma factor (sigma-70 family)